MPQTLRISAMAVEEIDQPRPHYRVEVKGSLTAISSLPDPTLGLLPEEIVMTVRLPTDIGSDLMAIKEAACQRALALLNALTADGRSLFDDSPTVKPRAEVADAEL